MINPQKEAHSTYVWQHFAPGICFQLIYQAFRFSQSFAIIHFDELQYGVLKMRVNI